MASIRSSKGGSEDAFGGLITATLVCLIGQPFLFFMFLFFFVGEETLQVSEYSCW